MSQELIKIETGIVEYEPTPITDFFEKEGGTAPLLEAMEKAIDAFDYDLSTGAKRSEITALSSKVSKTKTFLEEKGVELKKKLEEEIKPTLDRIAIIDAERSAFKKGCDELRKKARKPLTDWEEEEAERKDALNKRLYDLERMYDASITGSDNIKARISEIEAIDIDDTWDSHQERAAKIKEDIIAAMSDRLSMAIEAEAQQAELDRIRKENEELQRKEQERIAEKAAEDKAKADAQAAIDAANAARVRAEQEAENARQAERDKIEREKLMEEKAAKEREADKKHRAAINCAARDALIEKCAIDNQTAVKVLTAIANGEIDNVTIKY